jgi:hypothetical protein
VEGFGEDTDQSSDSPFLMDKKTLEKNSKTSEISFQKEMFNGGYPKFIDDVERKTMTE